MRRSVATVCLSGTLDAKLEAASAAGFDGIELFESDLIASPSAPEAVARRCGDLGLSIDLYQPFRDFEGVADELFRANLERASRKFELMERLGASTVLVCSNVGTATIPDDDLAIAQLLRLADRAQEHGITVAYEALAWSRFVSEYEHAWRLVAAADHPSLGVCLDSFHILSRSSDLSGIDAIPGQKIAYCQLADANRMSLGVLDWSRHYRLFPGEGEWDLPQFVAKVLNAGYAGPLSLEVFNDVFRESDPTTTAKSAFRSLIALEDAVRPLVSPVSPSTAPHAEAPDEFSFVEVTSDRIHSVERLLSSLGFTEGGRHKRKLASIWFRGEAVVVVNDARHTAAPELIALGVAVPDVQRAAARAARLHHPLVERDQISGEATLEAVIAPDGTEIYFSQNTQGRPDWWSEFGSGEPGQRAIDGFAIDHLALVQPWDRASEAILFYESVLGLRAREGIDLAGPRGLVRSRSLSNDTQSIRLALNTLPDHTPNHEGYFDHLAFRTDDIVGALSGVDRAQLMPVSDNYYDDLEARFGLDPDALDVMRRHNLMYDRDDSGEFLHAYLRPLSTFFVEIVERRGDYSGFGASNSPVRLAAQRAETDERRAG